MNKIYNILLIIGLLVNAQQPPAHFPTPAPVWEFTKYGNTPVSEYKGLVNLNIPLYTINVDNVSIPLDMNYYTGGIRVTEEAGLVGLGWSINTSIPMVIQQIKDKNDYATNTSFQKLPPFQGGPVIPLAEIYPIEVMGSQIHWPAGAFSYQTLPEVPDDIPYFRFVTDNKVIDWDGYYNMNFPNDGKYDQMFEPTTSIIDTEPDIFTVSINGDQIKFCRPQIEVQNINSSGMMLLPVLILKGEGYFVDLIANPLPYQANGYNSTISGIKITCPNGSQYLFNLIEKANSGGSDYTTINYKLTQIITCNGKKIDFNYSAPINVSEMNKIDARYLRRNGLTQTFTGNTNFVEDINFTSFLGTVPSYCGPFNLNDIDKYCPVPLHVNYEYYFLQSITTPNEYIEFSYSNRLDNATMKKLDSFEIRNMFHRKIRKIDFNYDYFNSTNNFASGGSSNNDGTAGDEGIPSNTGGTNTSYFPLTKRLKLISVTEEGSNPYIFVYNETQLPPKNSFSIDYWGFYNGKPNTSFKPNLTLFGYPQYTENINNDFNSDINFIKACTLEKIIYPTQGYTLFEYETHQFDNLIFNNSPIINYGGGLRIKSVSDFNFNDEIISKKSYNYFGGKCINKRILVKESTEIVGYDSATVAVSTPVIIATISNFLNQTENSMGDYIGYDRVIIKQEGLNDIGTTEKLFSNNGNSCINPNTTYYTNTLNYSNSNYIENGNKIEERIYNSSDEIQLKNKYSYFNRNKKAGYGMSKQYSGVKVFVGTSQNTPFVINYPITLATFYPIGDKKSFMSTQETTEYFNGNSKTISKNYNYDSSGRIQDEITQDNNAIFQDRNIMMEHTTWNYDLPYNKTRKENNIITEIQKFTYEPIPNYQRLKKVEVFPNGNISLPNKKMNYDLYDNLNNVLQYHPENGINTSIIWGYKQNLPVAKIENIDYASIPNNLILDIQTASDQNNETQLQTALDNLRNDVALKNAMVTTYTHIPLVGVSTITDSKGDKITYSYDAFGKLLNVRDKDGNLLSENQYNYKPQN